MAAYDLQIHDVTYSGETAPARDQFEALHIVSNSQLIIGVQEELTDKALTLLVMQVGRNELDRLEKLLVKDRVKRDTDDLPVSLIMFQDDVAAYALLIGKAVRANLTAGFSKLPGAKSDAEAKAADQA